MRVLHITKKYPPALGGDAVYVAALEAVQRGRFNDEVYVLCPRLRENKAAAARVLTFGLLDAARNWDRLTVRRLVSLVMFAWGIIPLLRKVKPAVVHVHAVDLGFIASWAGWFLGIPVIITCHSVLFPDSREPFWKRALDLFFMKAGRFSAIITVDSSSLKAFAAAGIRRYSFLPVGVAIDDFTAQRNAGAVEPRSRMRFLFVGRLEKVKGIEVLLEALKIIPEQERTFEVLIVGEGSDELRLKRLCAAYGLGTCVRFFGPVYDRKTLAGLYADADAFVLPSLREWCPIVLFEAWASGLAVIATRTGSIPDLGKDREHFLLVPVRDPGALSRAMQELSRNGQLRQHIAGQARVRVEQEFGWETVAQKLQRIYQDALAGRKA